MTAKDQRSRHEEKQKNRKANDCSNTMRGYFDFADAYCGCCRFTDIGQQHHSGTSFLWIWQNGFENSGVSLGDTSAEAREKQAKQLYAFAKGNDISGLMQETDTSGRTSFGELDEGIYLLAQIGNVESGTDKFESAPFLVNIPSEINGNVEYNVTIEPKAEWVSPETPPNNPDKPKDPTPSKPDKPNPIQKIINTVKTGDTTNIVAWFLIAIVSLGLIVGLYKKRKTKQLLFKEN